MKKKAATQKWTVLTAQPPQAPKTGVRAAHPDEKVSVAQERVSKLEAALRAVGDDDETAASLREALKKAR